MRKPTAVLRYVTKYWRADSVTVGDLLSHIKAKNVQVVDLNDVAPAMLARFNSDNDVGYHFDSLRLQMVFC
jgi:hypothetical protein